MHWCGDEWQALVVALQSWPCVVHALGWVAAKVWRV